MLDMTGCLRIGIHEYDFAWQLGATSAIVINLVASAVQGDVALRRHPIWHANYREKTHRIVRRYRFCRVTFTAQNDVVFLFVMRRI
jgi:hypothetical protein